MDYVLRDSEGRFVGKSRSRAGAHRASRTTDHLGASVNRAGMSDWQAQIDRSTTALRLERGEIVLLIGDPGTHKVMMTHHAYKALPPFEPGSQEQAEATMLASAARILDHEADGPLVARPFRAPHHTVSEAGLIGSVRQTGGEKRERVGRRYVTKSTPIVWHSHPGEVSLATGGVLLLDEVLEFRSSALDAVAVALRDGQVVHERGFGAGQERQRFVFPARPYAVVMTTTPADFEKYGSHPRYARIMGLVTRTMRVS